MTLKIQPSDEACGATVTGIDLSQALDAATIAKLRGFSLEHHVLVFPGQSLSDDDLERITLCFGTFSADPFIAPVPGREHVIAVERKAEETGPIFAEAWHSDWSFMASPPDGFYGKDEAGRSMTIHASKSAEAVHRHSLVRPHPETGRPALFGCAGYIVDLEGCERPGSEELQELLEWQTQERFVYRHRWEEGMLVMWDNRSVLHKATGGYEGHRRLLHRTTIGAL